jgi:hypothetical protein
MIARAKYFLMRWWLYLFYSTWTLWAECFIVVKIKNEWTAKKYNKKGWRNWNLAQSVLYKNTPKMYNIKHTLTGIPLTSLTLPHVCVCPKARTEYLPQIIEHQNINTYLKSLNTKISTPTSNHWTPKYQHLPQIR